jgi:RNA polymerase sigma-70 factor (ECF subfamily)
VLAGEQLRTFRGEGSPEGWLVRIVMNTCRRMNRGRKNAPSLHEPLDEVDAAAPGPSPEEVAQRAEVAERIGAALEVLEPRDRALVLMSEAEGWSSSEIAEALDSTPGAVRTRLSRARAALREALGEAWSPS